jgi:CubicO group peptidase (beta-lactamase class C family)
MLSRKFDPIMRDGALRACATFTLCVVLTPCVVFARFATSEAPTPAVASPKRSIDPVQLEVFVDQMARTSMREDGIAGLGVAIVDRSGPLLVKGYGLAGPGRVVDADSLFQLQSISKTLVWIAIMQLVEQGKISLEDPINARLPANLQIPDEGFKKPILIRDLIDHTSGFEDSALGHLFVPHAESLLPLDAYLERFRAHRAREPGEVVVYSNYGAALAGALVAHVSAMSWEDYAEQRIIRPLGMGAATFRQPYSEDLAKARDLPAPMPQITAMHLTDGFRRGPAGLEAAPREFTADFPAGALVASPANMAAYMFALLNPEIMERAGVLKAATVLAMRSPFFKGAAGFGDLRFGFEPYAMPGDLDAFGHGGDSIYQVATMTLIPSEGLGILVSANTYTGRGLAIRLREELVKKFLGAELAPPVYGSRAREEAVSYAGDYLNLRRPYFRTERGVYDLLIAAISVSAVANGDLQIRSFLEQPRSLVPLGGGVYRDRNGPQRIAFRPLNGRIGLHEPYLDTAWERVGYFESAGAMMWVIALALLAAIFAFATGIHRIVARRPNNADFEIYAARIVTAAAAAWLVGFALFAAFLFKGLAASDIREIIWWYPSTALVCACWAFAAAAALTLASLPSLAVVARSNGWSRWRRGAHVLQVLIFTVCAATFWRLGFIGFSGW